MAREPLNRRRRDRRPTRMAVDLHRRRGRRPLQRGARGLDFNRLGMAFVSRHRLRTGRELDLSLQGPSLCLHGVRAQVVSSQRVEGGYRTGVRFQVGSDASPPMALCWLEGLEAPQGGD